MLLRKVVATFSENGILLDPINGLFDGRDRKLCFGAARGGGGGSTRLKDSETVSGGIKDIESPQTGAR